MLEVAGLVLQAERRQLRLSIIQILSHLFCFEHL
jgi:hypothetical protein